MTHRINYLIHFILAIGFLFQQTATAQTYNIPNSVVGNGGETMSSGNYSVTGTTLPAPAALGLSSESFTHGAGFWAVYQATSDITAPATPTNLAATPGSGQVVVTWTANSESDLASYKVYGGTGASPTTLLSTITAGTETYTHSSLTNGTTYYYRITAVDNTENESGYSSEVHVIPTIVPSGLVAFYPFSGSSLDGSGKENDGTVNGATLTSDRFGNPNNAYSFDGIDDFILVTNRVQLANNASFSFWLKPNELKPSGILSKRVQWIDDWQLSCQQTEGIFATYFWGTSNEAHLTNSGFLTIGDWIHIGVVYNGSDVRIYKNNVLSYTDSNSGNINDRDYDIRIGDDWWDNYFNGIIDDIRIYNRTLTGSEIQTLFETSGWDTAPATPTDLTATPGNQQITLRWDANTETDFAKYIIYGGTSAGPTTKVDSTTSISDTTKTITGLTNGSTYYYRITAVDNAGNESEYSNEMSAVPALHKYTVKTDGTGDYTVIQTAIDATTDGDTVLVHPGTYVENINFNGKNIVVGSLFLTTQDTSYISSTIIDGNQNGSVVTFESGEDSTAVMSGFIIRNGATQQGGGIYCTNSSPNLSHLKIMSNTGSNIAGLFCYNNANPILRNSVITENSASNFGGGIHSEQNSSPIIENVIIKNNSADAGGGIFSRYDSSPKLINVTITGNTASHYGGIYTYNSSLDFVNVTIAENVASNNSGIYGENSNLTITNSIILESINILYGGSITATYSNIQGGYTGTGNIDTEPLFVDTANGDYRLSDYSPAIGAGTTTGAPTTDLDGNPRPNPAGTNPDMGAYENALGSPSTPPVPTNLTSIAGNSTVNLTWTGNQYSASYSVYRSNTSGSGYTLVTHVGDTTAYTNTGLTNDATYYFVVTATGAGGESGYSSEVSATPKRQLYTVKTDGTGDYTVIQTAINATTNGDTVLVHPGTYVENINFNGKNIVVGSLFLTTQDTSYISSTIIDGNQNGSVVTINSGETVDAELTGFRITNGNAAYGGGINLGSAYGIGVNSEATFKNLIVSNNSAVNDGGGLNSSGNDGPVISNCIFTNNGAPRGGSIYFMSSGDPVITNVLIFNNIASIGGGIYSSYSNVTLTSSTIYNNSGSGVYRYGNTNYDIKNVILWNNSPEQIDFASSDQTGTVGVFYSLVEGGEDAIETHNLGTLNWGDGNINTDPLFADTANGDYHLSDYSPAIGAGTDSVQINSTWYYAPTIDIDGNPRPNPAGSTPDMGAYEHSQPSQRPKAGTIADGLTNDVDWHNSTSSLSANWALFVDNDTLTYEYAIGTSLNSLTDVLSWTSNGTDTIVTKTGLTLTEGSTYYFSVRGTDIHSQMSDTTTTDGVTIDTTPPTISGVSEGLDSTVTDIDGNVYNTVTIGDQIWMKENLKVTKYRDGTAIPTGIDNSTWSGLTTGAYAVYNDDATNADTYGYLYNWYTVDDSRNVAPEGWHVPADDEWKILEMYLGMSQSQADQTEWRGSDEGGKLKETGTIHWNSPNTGATNESGFTALPGGYRTSNGDFDAFGIGDYLWSSMEYSSSHTWSRYLGHFNQGIYRSNDNKKDGFSVRCIRDNAIFSGGDADYQNSTDSFIISWSGSDASSGITNYEYALGTTSGGTETINWTSTGTATADTLTGLSLIEGTTYYLSVRATDNAGNVSAVLTGDGITIDLTAPAGTTVNDGTAADIAYTGSDSTLTANWLPFTENVSGIANYAYAIGSASGGTDVVNWTTNSTDTSLTKTGMSLTNGATYYTSVKATDIAGNVSSIITSDGVIVDTEGPISGSVFDGDSTDMDWTNSDSTLSANWKNFSDILSGINFYEYAIGTETDSFALAGWTTTADTFFVESNLTLTSSETYYVFVKAIDNVSNVGNISSSDGIIVDLIVPLVGELYDGIEGEDQDWQSSDSTLSFYWSGSDSRELNYYQYSVGTAAGDTNIHSWTSVSINTSITIQNLELLEEQTYFGNVRAVDRANNVSDIVTSDGITIDYTAPTTGTVFDDLVFTGTGDSLSAHWSGFSDSFSGIQFYEYAIGSTPQSTNIVDWTRSDTDSAMTHSGLTLTNGSAYYISVRATDFAGNISDPVTSDGVIVDIEPPVSGNVFDGTAEDEEWTNSFTTLSGNCSGFSDAISGIQHYEYAIGTTSGGTDVVAWTNNAMETSFFRDDLTLQSGTTYYISVRATDLVENTSIVATSNGITVDQFSPTVSDPLDGSLTEDIDWQQDNTTLMAAWQGNDTREIDYYEFSFGTAQGDSSIVDWTDNGASTEATITSLSLENGLTYYVNVRAYDMAGNRSDIAVSDGITIDFEPPSVGVVYDGGSQDIWLSNSSSSVSVNWSGFIDSLSGISLYEFALGSSAGNNDIIDWLDNGMDSSVIDYTGLNLQHAATYYFSVRATDLVGNVSAVASSDGFVIDIYPGPPTFVNMTFDTTELLSLTNDRVVDIILSEPSVSMEYGLSSIIPAVNESELNNDSIQINLSAPFASMDTLQFSISNLTDMVGLDSSYSFTIYTKTHGDYNGDGLVDVTDLTTFTTAWTSEDFSMELGPVSGDVPHLIPTPDNVFDLRDIMSFARMWHWSNNTPALMLANLNQFGPEIDITQSGRIIEIVLPDGAVSSQMLINYDQNRLEFENSSDLIVNDEIQLKSHFKEIGNLLIEKAYLTDNQEKRISLETNSLDKEDSYISIQYIFLDQYKNAVAQGFVSQKVIAVPDEFALHQNYPNPFNPVTTIQYDLPEDSHVNLIIYNILGREVKTLLKQTEQAGYKSIRWNGRNNTGQQVSAGMYFYRLETAGFAKVNKMILLR